MGFLWYNIVWYSNISMNILRINSKKTMSFLSAMLFVGLLLQTVTGKVVISTANAGTAEEILPIIKKDQTEHIYEESNPIPFVVLTEEQIAHEQKVQKVRKYLQSRNSPLSHFAEDFVKASEEYRIDYRIVAAISIIESGGGKKNFRSYNAWGWGKSGFTDWSEGIWAVSKGIGKYYSKGLTTPRLISYSYCPPSADSWARKVQGVMNLIAQY